MTFTKQGDTWALTHPYRARTDSTAIDGLLGRIGSGQMKSLAAQEATPADLHKYGLVKPTAIVTLISPSGRTGLMVGTPSPTSGAGATPAAPGMPPGSSEPTGEGVYAKDVSRPIVFTVDKTLADDLKKSPADYRLKDIFDFREFTGTKMEVTRGGATVTFEKKKEAPAPAAARQRRRTPRKTPARRRRRRRPSRSKSGRRSRRRRRSRSKRRRSTTSPRRSPHCAPTRSSTSSPPAPPS